MFNLVDSWPSGIPIVNGLCLTRSGTQRRWARHRPVTTKRAVCTSPAAQKQTRNTARKARFGPRCSQIWPNSGFSGFSLQEPIMGNKIVTEADRKRAPRPTPMPGMPLATGGRGQRVSLERGVSTRSKKNLASVRTKVDPQGSLSFALRPALHSLNCGALPDGSAVDFFQQLSGFFSLPLASLHMQARMQFPKPSCAAVP